MSEGHLSNTQKSLLLCAGLSYIVVIVSFFFDADWLTLLFFMIHSASLLYFTFLSSGESDIVFAQGEIEGLTERLKLVEADRDALSDKLEEAGGRLRTMEEELTRCRERLADACEEGEEKVSDSTPPLSDPLLPSLEEDYSPGEAMDLIRVAEETVEELSGFAGAAGLKVQISAVTSPLYIKASPGRIRVLFRNIIDNSIKYMKRAGLLVITISTVGDDIFIVLKDNGKGLPREETPHIFELNYQGSNRISGNGLGLTQAKAIVEAYGGTIYAKSTPDNGMGIYIQIPMD